MRTRGDQPGDGATDEIGPLLRQASRGDAQAWRRLVDLYARRVFALARSRLHDPELAEEVTQSVFVSVAENLVGGGYDERGRFESWLFRIASNRVRDEVRRRARQAKPTDPGELPELASVSEPPRAPEAQSQRLRAALEQLGEREREVIELRHHAGLEFRQIADLLAEPLGTVLARHHRTLQKLRGMLESDPGEARR